MKIALYRPGHIFNLMIGAGYAELFEEGKNYDNYLIICPVFWGLNSIDQVIQCQFNSALKNSDRQGYHNPLIPKDVARILRKYNAIMLLYNDWETRDLEKYSDLLLYFTVFYLKLHPGKVVYSVCDYIGHMKIPTNPHIISYDWMHIVQKYSFKPHEVVKQKTDISHPILSLNYRGNMERYAYCFFLFQKHRGKALFSYLDYPVDEAAKQLNDDFKRILRPVLSEQNQQNFNKAIPVRVDGTLPEQHQTKTLEQFLEQSCINVTFETNWQGLNSQTQQLSEKSYISIKVGKPFIIFTTKGGVLAHLRKQGYKTFEPFIDESYDNPELGYNERFQLLLNETDRLCSMTKTELKQLSINLNPIVKHNLKIFTDDQMVSNPFEHINQNRLRNRTLWFGALKGFDQYLQIRDAKYYHNSRNVLSFITLPFYILVQIGGKLFGYLKSK